MIPDILPKTQIPNTSLKAPESLVTFSLPPPVPVSLIIYKPCYLSLAFPDLWLAGLSPANSKSSRSPSHLFSFHKDYLGLFSSLRLFPLSSAPDIVTYI